MAKKHKKTVAIKPQTSRHLSRKERERKIQRIVLIVAGVFLILVLSFLGYGYYDTQYKPYHQKVISVNGTTIDMDYYLTMLRLYLSGMDPKQISIMGGPVLGAVVNNLLIIQKAPDLGFTVDAGEIDKEITNKKLPNKQAYRDIYATKVLQEKLNNEYFGKKVPKAADQVHVMGLVFETKDVANNAIKGLKSGTPFVEMAKMFGMERVTKERGGDLGWLPKGLTAKVLGYTDASVLEKTAFSLEPGQISQPVYDPNIEKGVGYWLLKTVEKDSPESCRISAMLLGSKEEADRIRERLAAGEDFATLAKEYSQDEHSKVDGGDLGWQKKDNVPPVIAEAFNLEADQISQPIRDTQVETKGGYWVIKVLEKEYNRPLEEEVRNKLITEDFQKWLQEQRDNSKIEQFITEEQINWAVNKVVKEINPRGK